MIVFDLKCGSGHVFEGWFASGDDFDRQQNMGLVVCPVCTDSSVTKAVMAPAVGRKGNQGRSVQPVPASAPDTATPDTVPVSTGLDPEKAALLMQALARAQAEALRGSEWVGGKFADTARAMHYGEEEARPIHGQVASEEARSLAEEGVEVAPLLFPIVPPEAQN